MTMTFSMQTFLKHTIRLRAAADILVGDWAFHAFVPVLTHVRAYKYSITLIIHWIFLAILPGKHSCAFPSIAMNAARPRGHPNWLGISYPNYLDLITSALTTALELTAFRGKLTEEAFRAGGFLKSIGRSSYFRDTSIKFQRYFYQI